MNKKEILQKIKSLDSLNTNEKAYLVNLVNNTKKYGLVWEDKTEDVEEELRTKLPILKEVKERAIINDTVTEKHPNHILIEGDNLHALTTLTFTHEGKVDVIYIDPPYNTGNKDFIYNDHYVDKEDSYRHSKWLSFMSKRLIIAKRLLNEKGVVFISIDDNEISNLILLCNEIFGENNHIATLPTIMNLKGNQDQTGFAGTHEYTLVYSKEKSLSSFNSLPIDDEEMEKWQEDEIGLYKKGAPMRATGTEGKRENRPLMFYPIFIDKNDEAFTISKEEHNLIYDNVSKTFDDNYLSKIINKYKILGNEVVLPMVDKNNYGRWRWGYNDNTIKRLNYDVIINRTKNGISLYKKQRPDIGSLPTKKPKSTFYKPEYSSGNGTMHLKNILGSKLFDNPKPLDLIIDFILIGINKKGIILDFFAGSGTTLEAAIKSNEIYKKNIEAILVTNNENQIAEKVTYERNKKVIEGYTDSKGKIVNGLKNNNLRYYISDYTERKPSIKNKKELTLLATELLCIKENCYHEVTANLLKANWHKLFTNGNNNYVYVIYDDFYIEEAIETLTNFIENNKEATIKVYVFSNGQYAYAEEFENIAANITLAALPDAIYKAYQNVLPKEEKEVIPTLEEDINPETVN
ncbi:site-specific DNA-methyltransferase [uncultured Polaribacter sp.]|uniref:site-specific DNA-methyltransferase n=1 Tax=uncultured Polaribacter sp. TaxID=174711 RepID=UPI00259BBAEC|nr:site-specific DNA-methyltransferase [uncultured Polaribacter sp.]